MTVLKETVAASAGLAALCIVAGAITGHLPVGMGLGAGLLIGSSNGHLVVATLRTSAPFALASVGRLLLLSAVAVGVALLLGPQAWSVLIGVAAAQLVMVVAAVRRGVRT